MNSGGRVRPDEEVAPDSWHSWHFWHLWYFNHGQREAGSWKPEALE
jgi:hypothetical protein